MPVSVAVPGITKLSELEIDVNKDWASYLIKNLGIRPKEDGDVVALAALGLDDLGIWLTPRRPFTIEREVTTGTLTVTADYVILSGANTEYRIRFPSSWTYGDLEGSWYYEGTKYSSIGWGLHWPDSNSVQMYTDANYAELFETVSGGVATRTDLSAAVDWTVEHKFKIEWRSGVARLYENGTLRATHTSNIPTTSIKPSASGRSDDAAITHKTYVKKDWTVKEA